MKSRATPQFWACYAELPREVKAQSESAFRRWQNDPRHPGLSFKKVHAGWPIWSVRVGLGYRALGVIDGDAMLWFWIGSHADYDRMIAQF